MKKTIKLNNTLNYGRNATTITLFTHQSSGFTAVGSGIWSGSSSSQSFGFLALASSINSGADSSLQNKTSLKQTTLSTATFWQLNQKPNFSCHCFNQLLKLTTNKISICRPTYQSSGFLASGSGILKFIPATNTKFPNNKITRNTYCTASLPTFLCHPSRLAFYHRGHQIL